MNERKLAAVDILVVLGSLLLFPLFAMTLPVSRQCLSSMARFQRVTIVWVIAAAGLAFLTYAALKVPWSSIAKRMIFVSVYLLLVAVALPNMDFGSADRSREKRALADMRTIASALEKYRDASGSYPITSSVRDVQRYSASRLAAIDPWGAEYVVRSSANAYSVASSGICGARPLVIRH